MDAKGGTLQADEAHWSDAAIWEGEGLRREAFFFASHGVDLYGSIYAAVPPSSLGVVFCNSWGYEANLTSRLVHPLSLAIAGAGGVALNFHYPGFGDSQEDLGETTLDAMADAAVDAVREASKRYPGANWTLAGLMLGASIAALAADRGVEAEELLLVQPTLRPSSYFARLERASKRSIGKPAPVEGFAFGYPLPQSLLASAPAADAAVEAALARFPGKGTIARYAEPEEIEGAPESFEHVCAPGVWRFGAQDRNHSDPMLVSAIADWWRQRAAPAGAAE